jgi:hypothetical protein
MTTGVERSAIRPWRLRERFLEKRVADVEKLLLKTRLLSRYFVSLNDE